MTSNLLAALTAHRTSKTAGSTGPTHPLHEAAQTGNVDALIKALDEPKIKVDQKDPQGFSALMVAAEKGNMEIAKYLVERGARVAAKDDNGETAVMKAAVKGYSDLCLFLIHAQCTQRKTTKELGVDSSAALANEKKRIVEAKDDDQGAWRRLQRRNGKREEAHCGGEGKRPRSLASTPAPQWQTRRSALW